MKNLHIPGRDCKLLQSYLILSHLTCSYLIFCKCLVKLNIYVLNFKQWEKLIEDLNMLKNTNIIKKLEPAV